MELARPSLRQAASQIGCSHVTYRNYITKGQLPKSADMAQRIRDYVKASGITVDNLNEETTMLSNQAKKAFGIAKSPFINDLGNHTDVYRSEGTRYISQAMWLAAKNGGMIAVIGESGAGKSVLRRDLIDRVKREEAPIRIIQPATLDKTRLTASAVCDAIVADLSTEQPKRTLEAKARQIRRLLTGSATAGNSHVLIIEEAHDLTVATLKYLKRFWELEDGFSKLLGIILIGQPELKMQLDVKHSWEAREVIRRCEVVELEPLNETDISLYLKAKFARIEIPLESIFSTDAYATIHRRMGYNTGSQLLPMSYPLLVNNLIIRALNAAAEIGAQRIDGDLINELV